MRKALSITAIALGYIGLLTFATVELAEYFGWAGFYNSASSIAITKFFHSLSKSPLFIEITVLGAFVVVASLAFLTIKLYSISKVKEAQNININIPVSLEAAYFGKTYATDSSKETAKDLDQQYNYLLNK